MSQVKESLVEQLQDLLSAENQLVAALPKMAEAAHHPKLREIFEKHLAPWIGRFFADLEQAESANLYRRIGTLGRVFIEVETEAFALPS